MKNHYILPNTVINFDKRQFKTNQTKEREKLGHFGLENSKTNF